MRFNTIPQVLAYYRTARESAALGGKLEIVGAFLENNGVAELYRATVEADVVRPEHHLALPMLPDDGDEDETGVGDEDDAERIAMVQALASRATLPSRDGTSYRVVAHRVPLRGLPSATGSLRQTPHADLLLMHEGGLGVARARLQHHHPLIAAIEALHHLAHLAKPRVRARIEEELMRRGEPEAAQAPLNRAVVLAPGAYYDRWKGVDRERRSGSTNEDVTRKLVSEMAAAGVTVSLWRLDGDWKAGMFTVAEAGYGSEQD